MDFMLRLIFQCSHKFQHGLKKVSYDHGRSSLYRVLLLLLVWPYGLHQYVITVTTYLRHSQYRLRLFRSLLSCHTKFCGKSSESKQMLRSDQLYREVYKNFTDHGCVIFSFIEKVMICHSRSNKYSLQKVGWFWAYVFFLSDTL